MRAFTTFPVGHAFSERLPYTVRVGGSRPECVLRTVRPAPATWLTLVSIASIAVIGGLSLRSLPQLPPGAWLAAGPALVLMGFVLSRSARLCVAILLLVDFLGLYQGTVNAGPIGVRSIDVLWFALIVWTIVERQANGVVRAGDIGQRQLVLFLGALGTSLLPLVVESSGNKVGSMVAWLRLIQTFSVVWLLPCAARAASRTRSSSWAPCSSRPRPSSYGRSSWR